MVFKGLIHLPPFEGDFIDYLFKNLRIPSTATVLLLRFLRFLAIHSLKPSCILIIAKEEPSGLRRSKNQANMAGMDGLNALPDHILPDILYFLPTKEAVRAQLISKRWRNKWKYATVVDFDFADFSAWDIFSRDEDHSICVNGESGCHEKFVRAIDGVLDSRLINQIDAFYLFWEYQVKTYDIYEHPVRKWILHVIERSPRELSIFVQPAESEVQLPHKTFTCSTLEEMRLQIDKIVPQVLSKSMLGPSPVNLPLLRKLTLGYYTIEADCMSSLLLGCPNLEKLVMCRCRLKLARISSNSLKSLVLNGCCHSTDVGVSIPSLRYLAVTVMSCQNAGFVFENMRSLHKANVCFLTADKFEISYYNSKAKILNGLAGVTSLGIVLHGSESKGMLKHALEDCPDFKNLKAVEFESFDGCLLDCVNVIDELVQHSAILEHLSYYLCKDSSNKTTLEEKLVAMVLQSGKCQVFKNDQALNYESLEFLMIELSQHMIRFKKMKTEETMEEAAHAHAAHGGGD